MKSDAAAADRFVGIDFGTTNTAVGLAASDGSVRLAELPGRDGGVTTTWRTVLYFEPDATVFAGAPAITRYAETEGEGRLVQSIKSHLSSAAFTRTMIAGKTWTLESLIAEFLRGLRAGAGAPLGTRAVVGRPVRYWGAGDDDDDARAVTRMRAALAAAGFSEVVFEFEPIAAALRYAARLDHEELLLVADFGGGTSDFSLVRVGPRVAPGDASAILGTGGLAIGGDSFDARIIDALVAPALGRDTSYRDAFGAVTAVPTWLFSRLRRWHHLSFLKDADTLRLLDRLEQGALAPERIERLVRVVKEDLGLSLHQAVEASKQALSAADPRAPHLRGPRPRAADRAARFRRLDRRRARRDRRRGDQRARPRRRRRRRRRLGLRDRRLVAGAGRAPPSGRALRRSQARRRRRADLRRLGFGGARAPAVSLDSSASEPTTISFRYMYLHDDSCE